MAEAAPGIEPRKGGLSDEQKKTLARAAVGTAVFAGGVAATVAAWPVIGPALNRLFNLVSPQPNGGVSPTAEPAETATHEPVIAVSPTGETLETPGGKTPATSETLAPTDQPTEVVLNPEQDMAVDPEVILPEGHGTAVFAHKLTPDGKGFVVTFNDVNYDIPIANPHGPLFSNKNDVLYGQLLGSMVGKSSGMDFLKACSVGEPEVIVNLPVLGATKNPGPVNLCNPVVEFVKAPTGSDWRVAHASMGNSSEPAYAMKIVAIDGRPFIIVAFDPLKIAPQQDWINYPGALSINLGTNAMTALKFLSDTVGNGGRYPHPRSVPNDAADGIRQSLYNTSPNPAQRTPEGELDFQETPNWTSDY